MADESAGFFFNVEKWFGSMAAQRMSFAEKGVYLVMLFQQWRAKTRTLPDSHAAVVELIAVTPEQAAEVQAAWPVVRRKFVASKHRDTQMYNVELERTRHKQRENFRKKQEAGHIAGKASAAKRLQTQVLSVNDRSTDVQLSSTDQIRIEKIRIDQKRVEKKSGHHRHTFCPPDKADGFCVPEFLHAEFVAMLGRFGGDFDLLGWYVATDAARQQQRPAVEKPLEWWREQLRYEMRARGFITDQKPSRAIDRSCPHENPPCANPGNWQCQQRTQLAEFKKAEAS